MADLIVRLTAAGVLNQGILDTLELQSAAYRVSTASTLAAAAVAGEQAAVIDELTGATEDATEATEDQAEATENAKKAYEAARKALKEYLSGIDAYYDRLDSSIDLEMAWESAIDGQLATLQEHGRGWNYVTGEMDLTTEAGRKVMQGYMDQRDVIKDTGQSIIEMGGTSEEARAKVNQMTRSLHLQMAQAGYTDAQIQILTSDLGLLPDQVDLIFATPGLAEAQNAIANVAAQVAAFTQSQAAVGSVATAVARAVGGDKPPGRRARGGPVDAGGAYIVGEEGPELMVMGSKSGTVIPAQQTAAMLNGGGGGGGTTTVVLELDGREFYRKVVRPQMQSDIQGNQGFGGR